MSKKGIYPYDYMDSFDKFNQRELPKKEQIYSILNDENISDEQYKHAKKVWRGFKLKNSGDFHDLYLLSEILLAEVFENFRKTCLYDVDMHQFIERGMRGRINYIANRYGKSDNKYVKTYDSDKPLKYITYLDHQVSPRQ